MQKIQSKILFRSWTKNRNKPKHSYIRFNSQQKQSQCSKKKQCHKDHHIFRSTRNNQLKSQHQQICNSAIHDHKKMKRVHTENENKISRFSRRYISKIKALKQIQTHSRDHNLIIKDQQDEQKTVALNKNIAYTVRKQNQNYDQQQLQKLNVKPFTSQTNRFKLNHSQSTGRVSIMCIKSKNSLLIPEIPSYRSGLSRQTYSKSTFNFLEQNVHTIKQKNQTQESICFEKVQEGVGKVKLITKLRDGDNQIYLGVLKIYDQIQKHQQVIIKKTKISDQYKSREQFMANRLKSPFITQFKGTYKTQQLRQNSQSCSYLNIIMQKYEMDLSQLIYSSKIPNETIIIYFYQMVRALHYLHCLKICHRDLKPDNFFVKKWRIVLGDFGMSKIFKKGYCKINKQSLRKKNMKQKQQDQEQHVPYVFQRKYRAPQLLLGYTSYTLSADIWALGCILAQMYLGKPLFNGDDSFDQLIKIMKILGSPCWQKLSFYHTSPKLPQIKGIGLQEIFRNVDNKQVIDLLYKMLQFDPKRRITAIQLLCSPYLDPIRQQTIYRKIMRQYNCANFFYFTKKQIFGNEQYMSKIIPFWVKEYCRKHRIQISQLHNV